MTSLLQTTASNAFWCFKVAEKGIHTRSASCCLKRPLPPVTDFGGGTVGSIRVVPDRVGMVSTQLVGSTPTIRNQRVKVGKCSLPYPPFDSADGDRVTQFDCRSPVADVAANAIKITAGQSLDMTHFTVQRDSAICCPASNDFFGERIHLHTMTFTGLQPN
jgi:hypothetical protein